jgi:hypothetical protein
VLEYVKNCPKVPLNASVSRRGMKGNYLRFKCCSRGSPEPKQASPSLVMKGFCDTLSAVSVGSVADTHRRPSSCWEHKHYSISQNTHTSLHIDTEAHNSKFAHTPIYSTHTYGEFSAADFQGA